jgi:hypothetical protein
MTVWQNLILLANDDYIFFSDPTLGGTYGQLATSAFIKVGDLEYGRITSICASQDFLIVSRERKVYYVNGNIITGNYRVQDLVQLEIGAWNNCSMTLVKDSVIAISAVGVHRISAGGNVDFLSQKCPKNFSTYDNRSINEDVSFRLNGFVSDITNTVNDGLVVAYDEYRELLVFMKKSLGDSCLVLSTKTGEIYEWDGLINSVNSGATTYGNSLVFIQSKAIIGEFDNIVIGPGVFTTVRIKEENKSSALTYPPSYPIKVYTSWLTAGEPSLEKILLQFKMFGRIQSNGTTSSIKISHYKDWDITTKITDAYYFPNNTALSIDNQLQYSHKKRFNSDKVLAASVGFELNTAGSTFELESMEVEFNSIQEGMKK